LIDDEATYRSVREVLRDQFRRGEDVTMEMRWTQPDGSCCDVLISAAALPNVAGQRGIIVTAIDITERKVMEAALLGSEQAARASRAQSDQDRRQLLALMNNLPGMAFRCKNDAEWTMLFVSQGCRALTGYDAAALLGNRDVAFAELIVPDDRAMVQAVVREGLASGAGYTVEYSIRRADGEERVVWERGSGQQQPGSDEGVIEGIIVDITERRLLENRLVQMHKLESLGVMAGGLAHDFNNILMAIMGTAELVQEDAAPRSGVAESMQTIIIASQRAADLTRQLLSFCGIGGVRRETVRLNGMVESLMPLLMATAGEAVEVRFQGEGDLPPFTADPGEVRQVVMSLFTNALEAVSGQGTIRIATGSGYFSGVEKRVESWSDEPLQGWLVWISVTDTGCGMTKETMARMFDPFFSTKATGRGMGLAAVMGILKALGGSARVRSVPGRGTTVKAYFPIHEGAKSGSSGEPRDAVPDETAPRRNLVLIADDEAALLALSEHMVKQIGYEVVTAMDGEEAVAQFERHRERLHTILLDLTMPRMDGVEAAERILAQAPEARIVLCTGYSAENLAERLDPKRVAGVLLKPFTRDQLSQAIGRRDAAEAR
jgi:PAS domain S-box-containing protein